MTYDVYKQSVEKRRYEAIANLPEEELLRIALADPKYRSDYMTFVMSMGKERATEITIDKMLIDNGLISYRKEKT